jgi:hypothetical protein
MRLVASSLSMMRAPSGVSSATMSNSLQQHRHRHLHLQQRQVAPGQMRGPAPKGIEMRLAAAACAGRTVARPASARA